MRRLQDSTTTCCGNAASAYNITTKPDFFRDFRQLTERTVDITDRTMDVSGAIELYVNNRAREIGVWYRDQLRRAVTDQVNSTKIPSCYLEGSARNLLLEHTSERGNRTLEVHKLLAA